MSRKQTFIRGPSAYRRGKPQFPSSGKAFLIITEGKKTEPNYLKALRGRLQLNATEVEIVHPHGTDPITLTKKAIESRDAREAQAKRGLVIPFDEVWVVFDLEKSHSDRRKLAVSAVKMGKAKGIFFAVSDPAFEFWLLLHEIYTTAYFPDCAAVVKLLKRHWKNYKKGEYPSSEFLQKLPYAIAHAERCREYHVKSLGAGNPSTDVDLLCRSLNSATRPYLQFKIGKKSSTSDGWQKERREKKIDQTSAEGGISGSV